MLWVYYYIVSTFACLRVKVFWLLDLILSTVLLIVQEFCPWSPLFSFACSGSSCPHGSGPLNLSSIRSKTTTCLDAPMRLGPCWSCPVCTKPIHTQPCSVRITTITGKIVRLSRRMILEVPTDLTGTWCYIITIRCIFNWAPLTCRVPWPGDARQGRWWTHRTWAETSWLKINEAAAGPSSWADFNRSKWASRSGYIQLNKCFRCRSKRILGMMSGSQSCLHVFSRWCGRWCRQMATDPEDLKFESCAVTKGHVMGVDIPQNEGGQLPRGQLGGYLSMGKKAVTSHTCHQQGFVAATAFANICNLHQGYNIL